MKTIIERGASWTLEETKLLLTLWGQDQISRKDTPHKRTKEVYEKISSQFNQNGFERTPDQVRTRVFNMIAEYRRILKDPSPEKMKKCIFFDAMHKIYQANHWSEVKSLIDDYDPETPFSPASNSKLSEMLDDSMSDSEGPDGQHNDNSSVDASSNAANGVSNNNNTNATASSATTNNSNSGSGSKTSATSDNINKNSINENPETKKNPASKDNLPGTSTKRIKIDSPTAGTSQGGVNTEASNTNGEGKPNENSNGNTTGGAASSASNAQSASSSITTTSLNNLSSVSGNSSGKLQSLLATSSSTASTPITKLATTGSNSTSYINFNSTKLPIIRSQFLGHSNGNESINTNGTQATTTRLPTTAAITSHQLYQAPVNTFDVTSSALLIDRMFAHLSRESENMREWIALEKDRIALEKARRAQEIERESRRERVLIDTLMKYQEQWMTYISRLDPRLMEHASGPFPEVNIPPRESDSQQQQQQHQQQGSSSP